MTQRKTWADLTDEQKRGLTGAIVVQVTLATLALIDIARRPKSKIRGSKPAWVLASFVNFVGPLSYFIFGRKR
jgi:hypothetical protein